MSNESGAPLAAARKSSGGRGPYSIILCNRPLPARQGRRHHVAVLLSALGHHVTQTDDTTLDLDSESVLWMYGNPTLFPKILRQLRRCPRSERPLVVMWFSEPLPPPRAAGLPRPNLHLRELVKLALRDRRATDVYSNARSVASLVRQDLVDVMAVSSRGRREFLAEHGIDAHLVPLGFSPAEHGEILGIDRDIDVLFLGAMVPRRRRLIRALRRRGVAVTALGSWFDPTFWGDNRTRILNRTKIFLNLTRYPGELAGGRMILGMASKCLVVSEPIYAPEPYDPGRHFVACPVDAMPDIIRHYLDREEERSHIADEGYRLVTRELTVEKSVARILDLVDQKLQIRTGVTHPLAELPGTEPPQERSREPRR